MSRSMAEKRLRLSVTRVRVSYDAKKGGEAKVGGP